jgi:hypothetical protein
VSEIGAADAARNNAAWCDAVCGAHGCPGELSATHWLTRAPTPPGYPNLVTLEPAAAPAMAAVRELERARPPAGWAVKDSFSVLSLETAGFRVLFEADWIVLRPQLARCREGGRWIRVRSEPELTAWESAWGESASQPRVFLPALLGRSEIAFLAALDDAGAVVAGVVASGSRNAVGLSNFFAREEREAVRAASVEAAQREFPGLPLVGYESGRDLAECRALGFLPLGPLRVWIREVAATCGRGPAEER